MPDGRMTPEQIAELTRIVIPAPLDHVTVEELGQALEDYQTYMDRFPERILSAQQIARKLMIIVRNTRDGYGCLGCKMGECAD